MGVEYQFGSSDNLRHFCSKCGNFTEGDICNICKSRQSSIICVVKEPKDILAIEKAKNTNLGAIKSTMRRLFPEHHPHELRYTFITRCKECGVNPELVMLWDGHEMDDDVKTSKVDRGYTDYSNEYQLQEAEKVNYKIPTETA